MPRRIAATLLFLTPLVTIAASPEPYDWPQWRGPNRDGRCRETGLLQSWPAGGPPLLWKRKDLGGGYSGVAVVGGRILSMSYRGDQEVVWALDEATGEPLWSTPLGPLPKKGDRQYNQGPRCVPTVDGDRLYVVGVGGDLACLEAANGKIVWRKNYAKDFHGKMMSGWGYSESPLVDGDKLICTPGGETAALAALDKKTGNTIWTTKYPDAGGSGYASVMPAEVGGIRMYITWLKNAVIGVAAKDGKYLWSYGKIANHTANIPTAVVRGDHVLISSGYSEGGLALLKLTASGGSVKAEDVYKFGNTKLQNHHGGMVLVGDHVYFGHGHGKGIPVCVEFLTGKTAWREENPPGKKSAGVLYADGNLIYRWQDGTVGLVEATPKKFTLKGTFKQPDRSDNDAWTHPVIANGKLYLRDQGVLLCYDVKKKEKN
jgi:outer membrane protein assembly factor BamB